MTARVSLSNLLPKESVEDEERAFGGGERELDDERALRSVVCDPFYNIMLSIR